MILGKVPHRLIKFVFMAAAWLAMLALITVVSIMLIKGLGDPKRMQSVMAALKPVITLKQISWVGLSVSLVIVLILYLITERIHYLLKPINRKFYTRLNNIAKAVPEVAQHMHAIAERRDYVIQYEMKAMTRRYKKAAKKQAKALDSLNRYPNGECLWPNLEYV